MIVNIIISRERVLDLCIYMSLSTCNYIKFISLGIFDYKKQVIKDFKLLSIVSVHKKIYNSILISNQCFEARNTLIDHEFNNQNLWRYLQLITNL